MISQTNHRDYFDALYIHALGEEELLDKSPLTYYVTRNQ